MYYQQEFVCNSDTHHQHLSQKEHKTLEGTIMKGHYYPKDKRFKNLSHKYL